MQNIHVLVVDDEWNMRNLLKIYLSRNGLQVAQASSGKEALELVSQTPFDIILLDVMMPDMDGWDVCRKIRETKQTPILMLTARTETKDKVHGLNVGADDYVVKPFEPEELLARIFALLRRSSLTEITSAAEKTISFANIEINPAARQVWVKNESVECTPKEFDLLRYMAEWPNRAFTREILLERVWGSDYYGDIRAVDTHVKNIREKLRKAGLSYNPIQTIWGIGYKFQVPGDLQ
jgi:two-component system response regulator ResD